MYEVIKALPAAPGAPGAAPPQLHVIKHGAGSRHTDSQLVPLRTILLLDDLIV